MWWLWIVVHLAWPLLLLRWGWNGKRIDHHPICRRCRFDLINLFGEIGVCPECGSDLNKWRAVYIGSRKRVWGALIAGGLLLLMYLFIGVVIGAAVYQVDRFASIKPDWMLQGEADSVDQRTSGLALFELEERMRKGSLSDACIVELVETALDCQADPMCNFHGLWLSFIETAWDVGVMRPEQYGRYLIHGVVFEGTCTVGDEGTVGSSMILWVDDQAVNAALQVHRRAVPFRRRDDSHLRLELIEHDGDLQPYTVDPVLRLVNPESGFASIRATWDITIMDGDAELITVRETIDHLVTNANLIPIQQ